MEQKRAATKLVKGLDLHRDLRTRALVLVAADSTTGSSLRDLLLLNDEDDDLKSMVVNFLQEETTGKSCRCNLNCHCHRVFYDCCVGFAGRDAGALHHALGIVLDYTDENKTAVSEPVFKNTLIQLYSAKQYIFGAPVYCQLTHVHLPKQIVVASHLWKRAWNSCVKTHVLLMFSDLLQLKLRICTGLLLTVVYSLKHLVGIEEINSSRNGLLLFRPIEWSFNNSRAIFVRDELGNWVYTLLDQGLRNVQLIDKFVELERKQKNSDVSSLLHSSCLCYEYDARNQFVCCYRQRVCAPCWRQL